ncbi:acyl carrier protein [Nostoc sp. LEGE 12450]|nr:acyl carrier protein [Nostoc sp. LEGE 12450]
MDTLKSILLNLGIPEDSISEDTLLHKDLQLDSVEAVEIALGLKRILGVNVKLESRQDMTLAQVCNRVKEAIAQNTTNHVIPTD